MSSVNNVRIIIHRECTYEFRITSIFIEELVRLNLRIKTSTVCFVNGECNTHRQMEQLNSEIRSFLEKMRKTLERLRHLAERQSNSESRKMLMSDVDKYSDQLAACHRSFRQANLR